MDCENPEGCVDRRSTTLGNSRAVPSSPGGIASCLGASCVGYPHVVIAVSHPIQHFCPLYAALSQDRRTRVRVFFGSLKGAKPYWDAHFAARVHWGAAVTDGFEWEAADCSDGAGVISAWQSTRALRSALRKLKPHVVVVYGYSQLMSLIAAFHGRMLGARIIAITDSEPLAPRAVVKRFLKRLAIPLWLLFIDVLLTCGDENERYYQGYGFPRSRMVRCPLPTDERAFHAAAERREEQRRAVRTRLGIPEQACVVLNVGKLIPRKGQGDLIRAVAAVHSDQVRPWLVLVGDGPERDVLRSLAAEVGLHQVVFAGFVSPGDLPQYYATADLYVHPSTADPHPLAITEAIFSGLPVVTTDRVGSVGATDDVQAGRNGWVVPAGDWPALGRLLGEIISQPGLMQTASRWSARISHGRGMQASVEGFVRGVYLALHRPLPEKSRSQSGSS